MVTSRKSQTLLTFCLGNSVDCNKTGPGMKILALSSHSLYFHFKKAVSD